MGQRRPAYQKRFGQHHLASGTLCRPLVEFLAPEGQRVLEIGPGGGVLTAELLAHGARVLAIEVDGAWAFSLRFRLRAEAGLSLAVADALSLAWERLPRPTLVAGNLPYNLATALIQQVLPLAEAVPRAAFLVQKEVAERLVAGPGSKAYGALSVLVAAQAEARLLGKVRPGSFRPPPKVESAYVGLTLKAPPLPAAEMPAFAATVFAAFSLRRKTLRNALGHAWGRERAEQAIALAAIPPGLRAEELGLEELLRLHRAAIEPPALAPARDS